MQARRDLVLAHQASTLTNDVLGWIARQGLVEGLDLVDLNYPQHFQGVDNAQVGQPFFCVKRNEGYASAAGAVLPAMTRVPLTIRLQVPLAVMPALLA